MIVCKKNQQTKGVCSEIANFALFFGTPSAFSMKSLTCIKKRTVNITVTIIAMCLQNSDMFSASMSLSKSKE